MKHLNSLIVLSAIYMLTILMGLRTASFIMPLMYPPGGGQPVIAPAVGDPKSVSSAGYFMVSILLMTAVMLLFIKYKLGIIITLSLFLSFFTGTLFTFSAFFGDLGIVFSIILSILLLFRIKSPLFYDSLLVFTISGIGAVFGLSLDIIPAVALAVIISVYDFIAVFYTKHMVTLAKGVQGKYPLMFSVPVGERMMSLGAGDVAMPLALSVSVMKAEGIAIALATAIGGLAGLTYLFYYIQNRKGAVLPALPPIIGGNLAGMLLALAVKIMF